MKDFSPVLFLFSAALLGAGRVSAQDSLSGRDATEIRYKAERMVKTELNELLNSLSSTGFETHEVQESIQDSYLINRRNRIFRDSLVLVEPDVKPGIDHSGQADDELLGKYLRDIDLLYKKSDTATIVFDHVRCSPVKKSNTLYVKVYFNSLFRGRSAISDRPYSVTNRLAEIKAEKEGSQWRLYIVRLAFFNPQDTVGDVANDLPIKYEREAVAYVQDQPSKAEEPRKVDPAQQYAVLMETARLQESNRQYKEAIESYQNAIRAKPEEAGRLQPHIRQLTDQFATLSYLQEKYNAGLYKEAIKEYTDAIRKDPKNSDLYLGRARCHEKQTRESKNIELAIKDYSEAYALDHNNLAAIRFRGDLYSVTGEYFKALSDYTVYLTGDRKNMAMYEQKSAMHVRLKMYNEAVGDLDEALAIDPRAAHIYLTRGLQLMQYGRPAVTLQDLQKASDNFSTYLRMDSSIAQVYFYRGQCELQLNRMREAAEDFERARVKGLDAENLRIMAGYATNFADQAADAYMRKDLDSALHYIDAAIAIDPGSATYRFTRGDYYYAKGDNMKAVISYDHAVRYNPAYIEAYYKRGLAWYELKDYKVAIDNFNMALSLSPQHLYAMKGRADALRALKDYTRAGEAYENALRFAPGTRGVAPTLIPELYNDLGNCYFELGQYEKTIAEEKRAIAVERNFADAYFVRGYAYYREGRLADAVEDMGKAISMLDRHPEWHYVIGRAYLDKKDYAYAAAQFGIYVQQDRELKLPDAVYREGYCNYMLQNYTAALPFYSRSLALHLDTVHSFPVEMGVVYLNTGKYDSAYYFLQKAYQLDSTNGLASYGIASSLALQGKADESFVWFERSFRMKTPSYDQIKRDRLLGDIRNNKKFKELLKKYF
jgi:tetratricopeptide (TPR) repeat protein